MLNMLDFRSAYNSIGLVAKTHYGPWQPCWISDQRLVYDHPMNISAKFDSNLFCGFRKKNENVKFP